jgi:hypothetical protein
LGGAAAAAAAAANSRRRRSDENQTLDEWQDDWQDDWQTEAESDSNSAWILLAIIVISVITLVLCGIGSSSSYEDISSPSSPRSGQVNPLR